MKIRTVLVLLLLAGLATHLSGCGGNGGVAGASDSFSTGEGTVTIVFCEDDDDCDDDNSCTNDLCLADGFCQNLPLAGGGCNDDNACTDGDSCNAAGVCTGTVFSCNDKNPCTQDQCEPDTGCQHEALPDDSKCDDFDFCTTGDMCHEGECIAGELKECPDPNQFDCVAPICSPATGKCELLANVGSGAACTDSNACTQGDACDGEGDCVPGEFLECESDIPCWMTWCNEMAKEGTDPCTGTWRKEGTPCHDGLTCTDADVCVAQADEVICIGIPVSCDDGNPCTVGTCLELEGCSQESLEEGVACLLGIGPCSKAGACSGGECTNAVWPCDDANPCTDDSCDSESPDSCTHTFNSLPCDDGDICTTADVCSAGVCQAEPLDCDDSDVCTDDSCDQQNGCIHESNQAPCNDGDPTTSDDVCSDGSCVGTPGQIVPAENTRFPEEEDGYAGIQVLANSLVINYGDEAANHELEVGQVLVGMEGSGYLRKVEAVQLDGESAILQTSPATLEEAIQDGEFEFDIPMELGGIGGYGGEAIIWKLVGNDFAGKVLYEDQWAGADVKVEIVDGGIWFNSGLQVQAYYNPGESNFFVAKLFGDLDFAIDVKGTVSKAVEKSHEIVLLQPLTQVAKFYVYGWPVTIEATLQINAGFQLAAAASGSIQSGLDYHTYLAVGAKYDDYKWWPIFEKDVDGAFHAPNWEIEGTASLIGYVRPMLSVKLYGAAGPEINFKPYLQFLGDLSGFDICWEIIAGLTGSAKMVMDLFFVEIESEDWQFMNYQIPLDADCFQILCPPLSCVEIGKNCGTWDDGCDGTVSCGICNAGFSCQEGQCIQDCTAQHHTNCVGGNLQWFDSCGIQEGQAQDCLGCGCANAACIACPDCDEVCNWRECDTYQGCDCGSCNGCESQCDDFQCKAPSHDDWGCQGGDVYWKDGCGSWEGMKASCNGCGCSGKSCNACPGCDEICAWRECDTYQECLCGTCGNGFECEGFQCVEVAETCGNGNCAPDEDCASCPQDCGNCSLFFKEDFTNVTGGPAPNYQFTTDVSGQLTGGDGYVHATGGKLYFVNENIKPAGWGLLQIKNQQGPYDPVLLVLKGSFPAGLELWAQISGNVGEIHVCSGEQEVQLQVAGPIPQYGQVIVHLDNVLLGTTVMIDSIELYDM